LHHALHARPISAHGLHVQKDSPHPLIRNCPHTMAKVHAGNKTPNFELTDLDGQRFSLHEALKRGPVVAAFFKVSCPVCQFTFPFLERLFKAYRSDRTTFWSISQDDARDTRDFCAEYGVTFPAL